MYGAEAIKKLLMEVDLDEEIAKIQKELDGAQEQKRVRLLKRLEILDAFDKSGNELIALMNFSAAEMSDIAIPVDKASYRVAFSTDEMELGGTGISSCGTVKAVGAKGYIYVFGLSKNPVKHHKLLGGKALEGINKDLLALEILDCKIFA